MVDLIVLERAIVGGYLLFPFPKDWDRAFKAFRRNAKNGADVPRPLILGGSVYATNLDKNERLIEQIKISSALGASKDFLKALAKTPEDNWVLGPPVISRGDDEKPNYSEHPNVATTFSEAIERSLKAQDN